MASPVSPELREQIMTDVKGGMSILDASNTHHVTVETIKKWMRGGTSGPRMNSGELVKAKKRIEFLESVVLELVLEQKSLTRKG